jgi:hypothetical protein
MSQAINRFGVSALSAAALLAPGLVQAVEVGGKTVTIQPRVEMGMMNYTYQQGAVSMTNLSTSQEYGYNYTQKELKYRDTLPMLGGGLTISVDRFFVDLNGQQSFNGSDRSSYSFSEFTESRYAGEDSFHSGYMESQADFDRTEYAISAGFALTNQLAVFAGYKSAKTDFEIKGEGLDGYYFPSGFNVDIYNADGQSSYSQDIKFEYDGPFLGLAYGLNVDQGFLKGALSFNFAAAFLSGTAEQDNAIYTKNITQIDGMTLDSPVVVDSNPIYASRSAIVESEGESVGLTFGVTWRGATHVNGLGYTLGVSGYNYKFAADASDRPDVTETALLFKVGVSYAF